AIALRGDAEVLVQESQKAVEVARIDHAADAHLSKRVVGEHKSDARITRDIFNRFRERRIIERQSTFTPQRTPLQKRRVRLCDVKRVATKLGFAERSEAHAVAAREKGRTPSTRALRKDADPRAIRKHFDQHVAAGRLNAAAGR